MKTLNPKSVAGPFSTYSHGIEVAPPARFLFGAGQAGVAADGTIGSGIEEQARLVWRNIREVLAAGGMRIENIVQLDMLLTDRADLSVAREIRDDVLGNHRPASTLMFVAGLANPEWLIEIDFVAALEG